MNSRSEISCNGGINEVFLPVKSPKMSEIFRLSPTKLKAVTPMIPARHGLPMIEKSDGSKIKAIINAEGGLLYPTANNILMEMRSPRFSRSMIISAMEPFRR
jgi:hypothetical protein